MFVFPGCVLPLSSNSSDFCSRKPNFGVPGLRPPEKVCGDRAGRPLQSDSGGRHPREKQRKALQKKCKPNLGFLAIFGIPIFFVILRLNNGSSKMLGFLYSWMFDVWKLVFSLNDGQFHVRTKISSQPRAKYIFLDSCYRTTSVINLDFLSFSEKNH